jgi:hypothetical protein
VRNAFLVGDPHRDLVAPIIGYGSPVIGQSGSIFRIILRFGRRTGGPSLFRPWQVTTGHWGSDSHKLTGGMIKTRTVRIATRRKLIRYFALPCITRHECKDNTEGCYACRPMLLTPFTKPILDEQEKHTFSTQLHLYSREDTPRIFSLKRNSRSHGPRMERLSAKQDFWGFDPDLSNFPILSSCRTTRTQDEESFGKPSLFRAVDTKSMVTPLNQNSYSTSSTRSPQSAGFQIACARRGAEKELVRENSDATQTPESAPAKDDITNKFLDLQLGP